MSASSSEVLRFDQLNPELILKNGNYLYKVPFRDDWAVLKVYYGDRSKFEYMRKSWGNVLFCNQTSFMPEGRWKTEGECMQIWRDAGFRVFDWWDDVVIEDLPPQGYRLFEYAPGIKFVDYFADESVSLEDKLETWRRFVPLWYRKHRLTIDKQEPRLVHENGDLKHVMLWKGDLLFFDFEMTYRSKRRVKEFVAREVLAFMKSLGKTVGHEHWDLFMEETVKLYPDHSILEYTHDFAFRNPNPVLRTARWIDRHFKTRAKKPFSKYNAARKLNSILHNGVGA